MNINVNVESAKSYVENQIKNILYQKDYRCIKGIYERANATLDFMYQFGLLTKAEKDVYVLMAVDNVLKATLKKGDI